MRRATWGEHLRYRFDNFMSRGTGALIGGLALLSLVIIFSAAAALTLGGALLAPAGGDAPSFIEASWAALMRALDAGTLGGDSGWGFRLVMFVVTLGGVFITSTLIGVLTAGVEAKLEDLRKGRSRVIERDHTVILGWSPQIFSIIAELVVANANRRRPAIVVLGTKDKVAMEDEIREKVGDLKNTRVVCRTGSPIDPQDIEIANPQESRAIIILPPETANADTHTIKTLLAITNSPTRRAGDYHIVTEIRDPRNMEAARLVGRHEAQLVQAGDLIARITAQTCRQSGLSVVYTDLFDSEGDEVYFKDEPALAGQAFGEVLFAYRSSAVIGLQFRDGRVQLNPPMDTVLQAGDRVIAISEDDDTVHLSGPGVAAVDAAALRDRQPQAPTPERTLLLGWNGRAPVIIRELDNYVAPGSAITIVTDAADAQAAVARECPQLKNETLSFQHGDTTARRLLEGLDVTRYDHVIVLSDSAVADPQEADARALITLLHLRDMAERQGRAIAVVSEMLDARNRELAQVARADDFIVSDELISLVLAQISENRALTAVFQDLLDPDGSEIYLKPAGDYVALGTAITFYTVLEAARRRGQVAIGYRLRDKSTDPAAAYGVVLNPDKGERLMLAEQDHVIVLAEA